MNEEEIQAVEHVHLVNGEQLFGPVMDSDELPGIVINNPLKAAEIETGDGETAMALTPLMPFAVQDNFFIPEDKILMRGEVHSEMSKFYFLSSYFADKNSAARYIDMVQNNVTMSNMIMDETAAEKSKTGNLIIPEFNIRQ